MADFVLLVGIAIMAVSLCLMVRANSLASYVGRVFAGPWVYGAALLRLLLGAGLIAAAPTTRWALAVEAAGWLLVLGALALVVVPRSVSRGLATRFAGSLGPVQARLWLLAALLFGAFLTLAALA